MNSKQLVLDAIKNKEVERIPWVPFVGCHAAKIIGVNATDYFNNADLIVEGVTKAAQIYRADGIPALFDLQIEAEALGCELQYADKNPPSVRTHVLEQGKKLEDLKVPNEKDGRFPVVLDSMKRISDTLGKDIAIYGLITGPFTLALHLQGTEIFFEMHDNPQAIHKLMAFCTKVAIKTSQMYIDAGCDIIAVVDPMTSQISPDAFAQFVRPYCKEIFDYVRERKKLSSFFVCGNAKRNVEEMCKCGPDNISIDENIPLDYVKEVTKSYDISFGGNIKLTVTILFGTPTDSITDAKNCMEIGGKKGFLLAPGCDIPFDAPEANLKAVAGIAHGEVMDVFDNVDVLAGVEYDLPDYENEKQVILDIITLDSDSCAPCQYMMEAVKEAVKPFGDKVTYTQHKIINKESVVAMIKLGVKNLPTICIDGDVKYISLIPDKDEFVQVIREYVDRKATKA